MLSTPFLATFFFDYLATLLEVKTETWASVLVFFREKRIFSSEVGRKTVKEKAACLLGGGDRLKKVFHKGKDQ